MTSAPIRRSRPSGTTSHQGMPPRAHRHPHASPSRARRSTTAPARMTDPPVRLAAVMASAERSVLAFGTGLRPRSRLRRVCVWAGRVPIKATGGARTHAGTSTSPANRQRPQRLAGAPASFAWLEPLLVFHGRRGAVTRPCTHLGYTEVIATEEATLEFEARGPRNWSLAAGAAAVGTAH